MPLRPSPSVVYLVVWSIASAAAYGSESQPVLKGPNDLLSIGEVRYVHSAPNDDFTLTINIRTAPGARIDHNKVKVQVLLYDTIDPNMVVLTDARAMHRWRTTPENWMRENPQVLTVHHSRPQKRIDNFGPRRHIGYIVRVFYGGTLQDVVSNPKKLLPLVLRPKRNLSPRRAPR